MAETLLQVEDLKVYLDTPRGTAKAVDGVSFAVGRGETRAIVGESGCGKSMTALSLLQLVPEPAGYVAGGRVLFEGSDLLDRTWEQMREVRGRDIAMIFQEPMTSLNPTFTVGGQIREAMTIHGTTRREAETRAVELLERVGMREPAATLRQYPHELSGGMRQRVMIAIALANRSKLLIADEPTTALDVTVQAQILALIRELQRETGMAVLLITHDLGIVAEVADTVSVMYAGQVVEDAPTRDLFRDPRHPYTKGLFASLPSRGRRGEDLATLEGTVPEATAWPTACRFAPRCPYRWESCVTIAPKYRPPASDRPVRCHLYDPTVPGRPQDLPLAGKVFDSTHPPVNEAAISVEATVAGTVLPASAVSDLGRPGGEVGKTAAEREDAAP
jgi:oligopeptide/dipeptide ABC transporter ATP-binding protein